MTRHLRIVAGDLFSRADRGTPSTTLLPDVRAPALAAFIARSDRLDSPGHTDKTARIAAAFQLAMPPDGDFPVAPYSRLADGGVPDSAFWLRADPVHLVPHLKGMQLVPAANIGLTAEEGAQLASELGEVLAARDCHLEARTMDRWYLRVPRPLTVKTTSLSGSDVRELRGQMPDGPDGPWLRALLTEVQLVLHASPVNASRVAERKPPVNSLWFWGGGVLDDVATRTPDCVWSDDPLAIGLAIAGQIAHHSLPANAMRWLAAASPGTHLVVFQATDWHTQIEPFENLWLAPLVAALRDGDLDSLTLAADNAPLLRGTRSTMRRWWRRQRKIDT